MEHASPRLVAVESDVDLRGRHICKRLLHLRNERRDPGQPGFDFSGNIAGGEQITHVGMTELSVQVHHFGARYVDAVLPRDVNLDGEIGDVLLFGLRRGLHFGQLVAAVLLLQDVHRDKDSVGGERGFEDHVHLKIERKAGALDPCLVGAHGNQHCTREPLAGECGDLAPLVKAVLQDLVRLELLGLGLVDPPPEESLALDAGDEAGLSECQA